MSKALNELKKATLASYVSKLGITEARGGMDDDTWNGKNPKNPLVTLHATKEKKIDGREPMIGHMHLSTAAGIHGLDHEQALSDIRVHGQHVGGDKSVRVTLSQHQKVWEETVNEAPLSPEHKAAIKALKSIPTNYSHSDLKTLKKHADDLASRAGNAEYSARYDKNQRVQNRNKKRKVIETQSSIKNQEGHILHMKKQSINSYSYDAHVGRGGPKVDSGSWSAIKYKHKIGGYNRHFNKAKFDKQFEETIVEAGKNPYGPGYKLVDKEGNELKVGHKFMHTSHHEGSKPEHHEITGWQSGEQRGNSSSSGRVAVRVGKGKKAYDTEYFPHVFDMKVVKEDVEEVNELKTSTLASVATKRFAQAQVALKAKDFGGYVKNKAKSMKAADATTPKSGWSPEDDKKEEVTPVSATEKYRQIKEAKTRKALRGYGPPPAEDKPKQKNSYEYTGKKKKPNMGDLPADVKLHGE